ncbi:RecT family recombinase [Moraxella sp. ZJ142]|uniref:RecT family recombinase n=1 Tax=Moraxella marmotae TaxID=3344520 RepID=UPI0035D4B8F8
MNNETYQPEVIAHNDTELNLAPSAEMYPVNVNTQLFFDDKLFDRCTRIAEMMATAQNIVPNHFMNQPGSCFAIISQALRWGMDPFAVAQKTFLLNGVIGYEAQLVASVINARAPIHGSLKYTYEGPWEEVIGNYSKEKREYNNKISWVNAKKWSQEIEMQVSVTVSACLKGEDEPRELKLYLAQAEVRNSPLWVTDPRQQLAYLAAKRWARLHAPEVLLGVYTPDELEDRSMKVVHEVKPAPETVANGTEGLKQRLASRKTGGAKKKATKQNNFEGLDEFNARISTATDMYELKHIGQEISQLVENEVIDEMDRALLENTYRQRQNIIKTQEAVATVTIDNADEVRNLLYGNQNLFSHDEIQIMLEQIDNAVS